MCSLSVFILKTVVGRVNKVHNIYSFGGIRFSLSVHCYNFKALVLRYFIRLGVVSIHVYVE